MGDRSEGMNIAGSALPTVGFLALRALRRDPDRRALTGEGGDLTGAGAADLIGRYQSVLAGLGLARGSRIGVLSSNRTDAWCAGIAAMASGMAVTWLNSLNSFADHLYQLHDVDVAALIVDVKYHAERGAELAEALHGVHVLTLGAAEFGCDMSAAAHLAGASRAHDVATFADVAWIPFTGGTTGRPKGVLRRQHAATSMLATSTVAAFEFPTRPRYLAVAPISHVGATKLLPALLLGGSIHMQNGFDPGHVLHTIERERISTTLMVPTMIYDLLDSPELDHADLSSLELVLYGAAPMSPPRLIEGLDRIGPIFSQLYGQTECYPVAVLPKIDHRADAPELFGSCGIPVATADVRIVGGDGQFVEGGEIGEICVRSSATMDEYLNLPDLTAETLADGWLRTGDLGRFDEQGYLYLCDRKKDLVITGGFNVYPREVEDALHAHPDVLEASVFGVPDERWGEAVTAAVVLRAGSELSIADLQSHVRATKGPIQTPKVVHVVEAIPRTSIGKIDKPVLRARFSPDHT